MMRDDDGNNRWMGVRIERRPRTISPEVGGGV